MASQSSAIVAFYTGAGTDHATRSHADLVGLADPELERIHDYIQWLFPLRVASAFNWRAPTLTDNDVAILRASPIAQQRLTQAAARMERFYKLGRDQESWWAEPHNHNLLRITRILSSLSILGLENHAVSLHQKFLVAAAGGNVPPITLGYWLGALQER